jgi:hypothetical protein
MLQCVCCASLPSNWRPAGGGSLECFADCDKNLGSVLLYLFHVPTASRESADSQGHNVNIFIHILLYMELVEVRAEVLHRTQTPTNDALPQPGSCFF